MASSQPSKGKNTSFILWIGLWAATIKHAGLTFWAMLSTAQLPPGYQVPPQWATLFGSGPNSESYWTYVIALGVGIFWEIRVKGSKTYAPSGFLPDIFFGEVAFWLWAILWGFAHLGQANGWFPVPEELDKTLITCFILVGVQSQIIKNLRKPEETTKVEPEPTQVIHSLAQAPSLAVTQPKTAPKPVASGNNESTQKLLDYIHQNSHAKTGALVEALGSPRRSVIRTLNKLIAEGRLVREGNGPGAVYKISDSRKTEKQN